MRRLLAVVVLLEARDERIDVVRVHRGVETLDDQRHGASLPGVARFCPSVVRL
jgi:hypothetical protein